MKVPYPSTSRKGWGEGGVVLGGGGCLGGGGGGGGGGLLGELSEKGTATSFGKDVLAEEREGKS